MKTFSFWTIIYIESEREIRAIRAYNPYYFPKLNCFGAPKRSYPRPCHEPALSHSPTY
nr:MAG TPA: hypothetical protein [Caudoviricetes sp.]